MTRKRIQKELKTIQAMIYLYCRTKHGMNEILCTDCGALLNYAAKRLDKCPYGEQKPACRHCAVHCYKSVMRKRIRDVMRYSGPRMLLYHPLLTIRHLLNGLKPAKNKKNL